MWLPLWGVLEEEEDSSLGSISHVQPWGSTSLAAASVLATLLITSAAFWSMAAQSDIWVQASQMASEALELALASAVMESMAAALRAALAASVKSAMTSTVGLAGSLSPSRAGESTLASFSIMGKVKLVKLKCSFTGVS